MEVNMPSTNLQMNTVVAPNGFIPLGRQYAGSQVSIEQPEVGLWHVRVQKPQVKQAKITDPLDKWIGTGLLKMPTDEIMRITRGDDWNR
jgi:hypothetical protein